MPDLFIDTEFNGYNGDLISMAIVCDGACKFYEVLECLDPTPWVAEHVMPHLNNPPIPVHEFQSRLEVFLRRFGFFTLYADWPEDIAYFCKALITGPGQRIILPSEFTMKVVQIDSVSTLPHNALADAIAFRDAFLAA